MDRWRGLKALVVDAVEHGSRAVERIQKETAKVPFDILEQVPPLTTPVKGIRFLYDTGVSGVHGMIRIVNRATGEVLDVVLDAVEREQAKQADAAPSEPVPPEPPHGDAA